MGIKSNSYDDIPYGRFAFPQTHPDRLATLARIFGLAPPRISTCRVLELGCASGANLIPMAFNLPEAHFLGIDLSQRQVQQANEIIGALGIANIAVRHASILDVDESWGEFDYIVCHGVFSWVDSRVQEKILEIAAINLAADGVAYVSYNTYPGWHMRESVRRMMRYHAGRFERPSEQIEQARALLDFLTSAAEASGPYGQLLRREAERLSGASDSYLYHEHLEQTNVPLYFYQFVERAEAAGLQYLAEADFSDMLTALFPESVAATLEQISPDILHLEQYMDFVRNRLFRQTLLCDRGQRPKRALTPAILHGLPLSSPAVAASSQPDLAPDATVVFTNGSRRAESALPATKAALTVLMERWPQAIDVDELSMIALDRAAPFLAPESIEDARRSMMSDLFKSVVYGLLQLHTESPRCSSQVSDTPRAHQLAAFQAQTGDLVVNTHHQMFQLDTLAIEVLKLANGERHQSQILDGLLERQQTGALSIPERGELVNTPEVVRHVLAERLPGTLTSLKRSALLVG